MFARIQLFAVPLAIMAAVSLIYLLIKHVLLPRALKAQLKSVSWMTKNALRFSLPRHLLTRLIGAPVLEELIFRAPLVIAFTEVTPSVWAWIILSNVVFAGMHYKNAAQKRVATTLLERHRQGALESDSLEVEMEKIRQEEPEENYKKLERIQQAIQLPYAFLIGVVSAYFAISRQSLWLSVAIHAVANIALPLIAVVLLLLLIGAWILWDRLRWGLYYNWRNRRRKRDNNLYW